MKKSRLFVIHASWSLRMAPQLATVAHRRRRWSDDLPEVMPCPRTVKPPRSPRIPVADSTDLYAFVSPDNPDTVTIIANYVPLESPDGGPNFYEFGDDVLYAINIDNNGDGKADVVLPVPLHQHHHQPRHVPLQHRADRVAHLSELEPAPALHA